MSYAEHRTFDLAELSSATVLLHFLRHPAFPLPPTILKHLQFYPHSSLCCPVLYRVPGSSLPASNWCCTSTGIHWAISSTRSVPTVPDVLYGTFVTMNANDLAHTGLNQALYVSRNGRLQLYQDENYCRNSYMAESLEADF